MNLLTCCCVPGKIHVLFSFPLSFFICLSVCLKLPTQLLSSNAIAVRTPQSPRAGEVDITLVYKGSQFCINNPGKFLYISELNLDTVAQVCIC